jgi:hypothetical protein
MTPTIQQLWMPMVLGWCVMSYSLVSFPLKANHRLSDYELVLSGGRPELHDYLSPEITQLLHKCWHMILANGLAGARSLKSYMQKEGHRSLTS